MGGGCKSVFYVTQYWVCMPHKYMIKVNLKLPLSVDFTNRNIYIYTSHTVILYTWYIGHFYTEKINPRHCHSKVSQ